MFEFITEHAWTWIFYIAIILILFLNRKRFDRQAKFIFLYKTKVGLKLMNRLSHPKKRLTKILGPKILYTGTVILLAGIFWMLSSNFAFVEPGVLAAILVILGILCFAYYMLYDPEKHLVYYAAMIFAILGLLQFIAWGFGTEATGFFGSYAFIIGFVIVLFSLLFRPIKQAANLGIWVGYIGMAIIVGFIIYGIFAMFLVPDSPPVVSPVIPGVPIPGSPIQVPLVAGWIALFVAIVVHEFSHGVVARAHGIKVNSSGLAFFGPIGGAFVEPDEKQLNKHPKKVQNALFAAGPFSNVLTAGFFQLLLAFILTPLILLYLAPVPGVAFFDLSPGGPAETAGVQIYAPYTAIDGKSIDSPEHFLELMQDYKPGDRILLTGVDGDAEITLGVNPENKDKPYLGVFLDRAYQNRDTFFGMFLLWLVKVISWIVMLNLGLGLANLLPLGPVDGGRMFLAACMTFFPKDMAKKVWSKVTVVLFIILIILVFVPIIRAVVPMFFATTS